MKYNKLFVTMMCLVFSITLFAQQHNCGLQDHHLLIERLLANKASLKANGVSTRNGIKYVPVKYHIIGRTDGSGRTAPKNIMDMHCGLNEFFLEDDGIQFYIKDGFNYINNDAAYSNHSTPGGVFQFNNNKVSGVINIYIPQDASPSSGSIGVTLGYYSPGNDWIVIRKADANGSSLTAPHELGHYFSLPHPFNGWDSTPYDASVHGETAAIATSPGGTPTELMDGSNCETAGDFICDTPPSYLFFSEPGCDYNGGARDPNGVLIDPDEYNIMDYFSDSCNPKYFTPEQKALMAEDYDRRLFLETDWTPNAVTIDNTPVLALTPEDDSNSSGFDHVRFEWEAATGADRYLLEISRLSDFSFEPWVEVVSATHKDIWGFFEADKNYFWRVTPFNPYNTCAPSSASNKFRTGTTTSIKDISEVTDWSINPNPVSQNNMMISLDTEKSFDAEISIISTTGQILQKKFHHFASGSSSLEVSVNNIPNGMYIVNMVAGERLINKKIIIAK